MKKSALAMVAIIFSLTFVGVFYNACSEKPLSLSSNGGNFSNNILLPGGGAIRSVKINGTDITVSGDRLDSVTAVNLSGKSTNVALNVLQKTSSSFVARASNVINLSFGAIYHLVITTAGAQTTAPIQAVVNPGSCADDEIMLGYNPDGSLKCRKSSSSVNFSAPVRFAASNGSVTTPQAYKLCVLTREHSVLSGACEVERLPVGTWRLTCAGAAVTVSVVYPQSYGEGTYSGSNNGAAEGAMYCYN